MLNVSVKLLWKSWYLPGGGPTHEHDVDIVCYGWMCWALLSIGNCRIEHGSTVLWVNSQYVKRWSVKGKILLEVRGILLSKSGLEVDLRGPAQSAETKGMVKFLPCFPTMPSGTLESTGLSVPDRVTRNELNEHVSNDNGFRSVRPEHVLYSLR